MPDLIAGNLDTPAEVDLVAGNIRVVFATTETIEAAQLVVLVAGYLRVAAMRTKTLESNSLYIERTNTMKRSVLVMTVVILLAAGSISTVAAQGGQPSERACVGTTVKGWAHDPELHPLGQIVSYEAQAWHPFGQTTISPFARYCELPE